MKNFFLDYSVPELIEQIKSNKISAKELIDHSNQMYVENESNIHAWTNYNTKNKDIESKNRVNNNLSGIPFGAKDIFNTINFPTEMGSIIWKDFTPGNNARVLDSLINSGAVLMGKTVTAEFAVHELNQTINPHNKSKTPGTSSSGSAAAVSSGMVPFAIGSQAAGSIIRPASFCGVWGYKPSFGLIPRTGALKTSDSLDTVGFLAAQGKSLRTLLDNTRVRGPNYPFVYKNIDLENSNIRFKKKTWKVGFIKTNVWDEAKPYVKDEIEKTITKLSNQNQFNVEEVKWPKNFLDPHEIHEIIYTKSLGYYFIREKEQSDLISDSMLSIMEKSEKISTEKYVAALKSQERFTSELNELLSSYDFLITTSTSSSAPDRSNKELKDTSLIWTLSHMPAVSVPLFRCPDKLPFGLQLISKKWSDYKILNAIEELIDLEIFPKGSSEILSDN